ncbi:hypothetical protein RHMOL_Rhmol08G0001600 [Rhododendron molle]|uniref:Uncharacterized protein n=1 Tax=Rhododendron molle TaxID=49168 RepID=A0ACC0MJF1_RHOML|nr:hypothetical protein RHMOL_Rhmol08G0001600 [Rhododendron molle]
MVVAATTADSSSSSSSQSSTCFRELDHVFLQTQTRIWLGEVLHTRLDGQLNISDLLADGELLFEVSKIIWTMLLAKCKELRHLKGYKHNPIGSWKGSGRYRPYSNVDSFLKICRILGLSCIDLFSPSDVVEKRDTRKVCICIRSLSRKARSKQLNVPDFDIVTYPVTMPTNMVGCLRRSLELSNCSFTSSANYTPFRPLKLKFRQENSFDDCYSEASDDTANTYMGVPSYSSSTNCNYDSVPLKDADLENSPGVSSVIKTHTSELGALQGDNKDQKGNEYGGHRKLSCLAEPAIQVESDPLDSKSSPSVDSQLRSCSRVSHINKRGRYRHKMGGMDLSEVDSGSRNDESITWDSLDDNMEERFCTSHQLQFPDLAVFGTDYSYPVVLDEEDGVFSLLWDTDSYGLHSTGRNSRSGYVRRLSDDFEDVEVSSVTSMSSLVLRVLNLEFDDQFDADDLRSANVNSIYFQNCEADNSLDRGSTGACEIQDMAEDENTVHGLVSEISHLGTKLWNFSFSTHPMDYQEHVRSFNNEVGVSEMNLFEVLPLKHTQFFVPDNAKEVNDGANMVELNSVITARQSNCLPVACNSVIREGRDDDSTASSHGVLVEGDERHRLSNANDEGGLKHQSVSIQNINSLGTLTPYMVAVDNHTVDHNFVKCQPASEKHLCSKRECSDTIGRKDRASPECDEDLHYCEEHSSKDKIKSDIDDLAEVSERREAANPSPSPGMPHRRPLLKTVVRGTALFGMLFLLLHLRSRNGREKGGKVSKKLSQVQTADSMERRPRKEQQGSRVNGFYPAGKLKFGN